MSLIAWALVACRAVLGATFLVAGLAKLASPRAAAAAVAGFGAPVSARPLLRGLPWLETAVAAALAFAGTAWHAAWGAAGLLVVFIVAIAINLAHGRRPDCNCFGQVRPAPISGFTIVRNLVLLALASGLILAGPPPGHVDAWVWLQGLDANGRRVAILAGLGLAVGLRIFLASAREPAPEPVPHRAHRGTRSPAVPVTAAGTATGAAEPTSPPGATPVPAVAGPRPRLTGNGLPPGAVAPAFALPDLAGQIRTLDELRAPGKPVVLVFSSPNCESCQALLPRLPGQVRQHGHALTIVLVSRDTVERNLAKLKEPGDLLVLLQQQYEVAESFDITTSPAGIVVGTDGRITSPLAMGGLAVLQLITDALPPPPAATGDGSGQAAGAA